MASASAAGGLTEEVLRALCGARGPESPLVAVVLRLGSRESGTLLRASGYVIRLRPGGFMVALPDTAEVASFLQDLEAEGGGEPGVALHSVEVDMETVRGRFLGASPCLLADVAWDLSHHFGRATPLRAASVVELQKFAWGEQACRPRRASLEAAADNWIHDAMDEDTAADYVTGAEAELIAEEVPEAEPDTQEVIAAMQRRIEELEAREAVHMAQRPQTPATPTVPPGVLFSATPTVDTRHNTMARLRELAGAAPPRLGAHEKMARSSKPGHFAENLQQELTLEAVEPPELEEGLLELDKTITDPMQRMMLLQMQHLQLLTRQQQEKKTDPLQAALSGSETSGGGSGIKGCLAREAYVKLSADVSKTASAVQANAAQDLGLDPHQISSGMMKDYIEKRCPLGDQRLLIQVGYLFAAAWEHGFRTNNPDLMGHASKGLVFIDQTAVDYGRTNLSWLLTGLPEPQYSICQRNRVRASMTPFSRLASPAWVSANVAYMKDLDFLEGKIKNANQPKPTPPGGGKQDEEWPGPKKQAWKKKKQKQREDAGGGETSTG